MNERQSGEFGEKEIDEAQKTKEYIALARELIEKHERFDFPGVTPEAYAALKAVADEYPEYSIPVDVLLAKFKQGMKVAFGPHPESGNVYIMPLDSDNIVDDSIFPRHLEMTNDIDETLKKLIQANIDAHERGKNKTAV